MYYITLNIALYHLEYCSISHHSPDLFYPRNEDRAESYHGNHTPGNHHREEKARVGSGDGHQTTTTTTTKCFRRKGRKKDRKRNEGLGGWDGGIDAFVPFEEKDKFEEIEAKVATFTYTIPTERVSSEYRNSWRSSGASPTYPIIFSTLLRLSLSLVFSTLFSTFCSTLLLV